MPAHIGYVQKDKTIKVVQIINNFCLDEIGIFLIEHFSDVDEVEEMIDSTIQEIDEDTYISYDDNEYIIYDDVEDFLNETNNDDYCYLFKNRTWYVSKPNAYELHELETILEEEY